ncbi:follicle-stimulating hormone receptor-like [Anthonomus grandis grandis]|uniref:follicle-stimulating hormone receptor-like n=1 Tax=Anthonomus grandis grandis TaxID=2921223 RepID=UPI002165C61B|nr:follicle-stimulating hormone receptor-like [Anthonomus grandis grandis]XP_050296444.1 follicle-stimulating hormone receptor-like [Anthonomus grandis grandis]XP_050296445.1 follicle-stimulating hormone receptor-like [Anthonomus grandis grandis]XP_050296446.1 follicle-stimulating hormone receptor-like [Anthonomus grandis grandis]
MTLYLPLSLLFLLLLLLQKSTSDFTFENYNSQKRSPTSFNCSVYSHEDDFEVHCRGNGLTHVPTNLNSTLNRLIISETRNITVITSEAMEAYRGRLQDVILSDLPNLRVIEEGAFANISNLRTIYIYNAPQIKFIYGLLKGVSSSHFRSLRIVNTGLHEVPELHYLPAENTLFLLDLDHNKIEKLHSNSIKVSAQQVTLNFNDISSIEDYAFNGSQIGKLHITANPKLTEIGEFAFQGLMNLRELDLSQTSIKTLPYFGLETLEVLKIRDTSSLHTIPSLYDLQSLKMAKLTHHFHCCAFKYPKQHSPVKHAVYEQNMRQICIQNQKTVGQTNNYKKRKRSLEYSEDTASYIRGKVPNFTLNVFLAPHPNSVPRKPLTGVFMDHQKPRESDYVEEDDMGTFHSSPTLINDTPIEVFCGNISFKLQTVQCSPAPNALNPCEDIMGFTWLRNSVWFVVILAVVGNIAVIIVIWFSKTEVNVSRFLICNLAFADLCMGLYLLLIASMDFHSVGSYFNFAYDWQYGIGCQIAGFLTVFAGHLSIFTLTIVTLERWFAIKYAIDLTKRIRLSTAVKIMTCGWIYSIVMAACPLVGVSNYSSTSICLPMEVKSILDKAYLYAIFVINGLSLGIIVFCYTQIYLSLGYETRRVSHKGEMTIAKKMALLIFIDFATYTPVAFFGLCALVGFPLIDITKSKILLVFFYPLNSCANPYLYALMTSQYRQDLYMITSRCGMCKKKAQKYSIRQDTPRGNPAPLLSKDEPHQCCHNNNCCRLQPNGNGGENTFV